MSSLIETLLGKPAAPSERVSQIVSTITSEVRSGECHHWDMPFDKYVDERIGDLDLDHDNNRDYKLKYDFVKKAVEPLRKKFER